MGIGNDRKKKHRTRDWKTRKFIILTFRARQRGIEFPRVFFSPYSLASASANLHVFKRDYDRYLFDGVLGRLRAENN